jgi:hypothetical protein
VPGGTTKSAQSSTYDKTVDPLPDFSRIYDEIRGAYADICSASFVLHEADEEEEKIEERAMTTLRGGIIKLGGALEMLENAAAAVSRIKRKLEGDS